MATVQQVCALAALTVRGITSKDPIAAGDLKWIFARNCGGTEQFPFLKDWTMGCVSQGDGSVNFYLKNVSQGKDERKKRCKGHICKELQ